MLEVNPGDLNLQTIAGNATMILGESDLPNPLYVFGVGGGEYDYYLDPMIFRVNELADFLTKKGFNVVVDMPYNARSRPAVGISRRTRQEDVSGATDFCIIVMLFLHNRLKIN